MRGTRARPSEVIDLLSSSSDAESKPDSNPQSHSSSNSDDFVDAKEEKEFSPPKTSTKKTESKRKKIDFDIERLSDSSSDDSIDANPMKNNIKLIKKEQVDSKYRFEPLNSRNRSSKPSQKHDDSDSLIEIGDTSEEEEEEEESVSDGQQSGEEEHDDDGDRSAIQIPDSSPQRRSSSRYASELDSSPPAKITTKLPNLREKFSFKDPVKMKSEIPDFKKDFPELKRLFPKASGSVIIAALRKEKTLKNTIRHLKSIYGDGKNNHTRNLSPSTSTGRLDSLSHKSTKLSLAEEDNFKIAAKKKEARLEREERLKKKAREIDERKKIEYEKQLARKKAEKENIKSSKVVVGNNKGSSIRDRYTSSRGTRVYESEEGNEDDEDDEEEDDDEEDEDKEEINSDAMVVDSDDSIEEIKVPSKRTRSSKRKYEDDDDYEPFKKRSDRKKNLASRASRAERRAVAVEEDEDFMLPELELEDDLNIDEKILKLFNNAEARDIIDLSGMKPEQATIIIKNRPYPNMKSIRNIDLALSEQQTTRRAQKSSTERYIDVITQKLSAYSAIDTLLKQCFDYSKSITKEVRKWGVNLKGKNLNGELSITNVEGLEDESNEESSSSDESSSEDSDAPVIKKARSKKKFKIDGSENDDDYSYSGKKKIYKSNINNSNVKDKIGFFKKKPALLSDDIILKDYQQVGINWIHLLFQKQLSCILADEMGLGKTAQVIAFLSHLKKKHYKGPHLIVVPASTLENWLREFDKFAPSLNVIPYYGSIDEREELRSDLMENEYDVIVTTYSLTIGKVDAPFLQMLNFNVIVYDEGHMLKNAVSDRYRKLTKLKANFRLILTGTPLQNNLKELVSLLDFILPEIFDPKLSQLEILFDQKATTKTEEEKIEGEAYNPLMSEQAINKAKVMMSPFVLRRTKAQVMKDLPQKHTSIEYCDLVPAQRKIYDEELELVKKGKEERERRKTLDEKELKKLPPISKLYGGASLLLALRKTCNHPLLFRKHYTDDMLRIMARLIMRNPTYADANQQYIFEDMQVMSDSELTQLCHQYPNELGKFVLKQNIYEKSGKIQKLVEMLTKIVEKKEKVLVFSLFTQVLDILEQVLSLHNWKFLRLDGTTAVNTRQTIIDKFYDDETIPVMLLSTKAGGFGINLVCATNVILYDQSLNPHDDKQAEDRAHRVGQTREVHVTRLITKDSIEENILHLAFNKLQLDNSMLAQNVEDVLLKTVEDVLASKVEQRSSEIPDEKNEKDEKDEKDESAFDAFDNPQSLELVADAERKAKEAIVEIEPNAEEEEEEENVSNNKKRRRRNNVNYYDGEPKLADDDLILDEVKAALKNKKVKKDKNTEQRDQSYEPNMDDNGSSRDADKDAINKGPSKKNQVPEKTVGILNFQNVASIAAYNQEHSMDSVKTDGVQNVKQEDHGDEVGVNGTIKGIIADQPSVKIEDNQKPETLVKDENTQGEDNKVEHNVEEMMLMVKRLKKNLVDSVKALDVEKNEVGGIGNVKKETHEVKPVVSLPLGTFIHQGAQLPSEASKEKNKSSDSNDNLPLPNGNETATKPSTVLTDENPTVDESNDKETQITEIKIEKKETDVISLDDESPGPHVETNSDTKKEIIEI